MGERRTADEQPGQTQAGQPRAIGRPIRLGLIVILTAVLGGIAWYLLSPLFIDRRVDEATPTDAGAALVAVRRGSFGEIDAIHKGEGQATLYRQPDGTTVLRLESFKVTNGPDLYVYLSGHPAPRTSAQVHEGPGYEVAVLKGNVGDQNYELPASLDLASVSSVVIYCKRFTTVFSTAELQPV